MVIIIEHNDDEHDDFFLVRVYAEVFSGARAEGQRLPEPSRHVSELLDGVRVYQTICKDGVGVFIWCWEYRDVDASLSS